MDLNEEVNEFRHHVKSLVVNGDTIAMTTLEDIYFEIKVNTQGYFILHCSSEIQQRNFDDLAQILTTYSQLYRNSFSEELFRKLSNLNNS